MPFRRCSCPPAAELSFRPLPLHLNPTLDRNAEDNSADYYYIAFNGTVTPTSRGNVTTTNLEPGRYKLLVRALKLSGDLTTQGDYESKPTLNFRRNLGYAGFSYALFCSSAWLSPPIELVK